MEIMVLVIHVIAALSIIGLVLLQHGKGADVGAAFGSDCDGAGCVAITPLCSVFRDDR